MRDALAFGGVAALLTLLAVALTALLRPQPWPEVTPRILMSDPEFWDKRGVKLKTRGMESVGGSLRYRTATDQPYLVVVEFKNGKLPDPVPAHVSGVCGSVDGVVVLTAR